MTGDLPDRTPGALPPERAVLRASHDDRDRVVETLRVAAGDGRLTAEELDARVEAALSARTLGDLAALTTDLPPTGPTAAVAPKDVLVVEQRGGKYARTGRWVVPGRIELRPKMCDVTLDFTEAVLTGETLKIDMDMRLGKLFIVSGPGIVIDADDLALMFSKVRLHEAGAAPEGPARLRIVLNGSLRHGKVIERRPKRRRRESS